MGIEIWALVALAVILAVYLLPLVAGRRESMGRSRSEDRYSARLRVLRTGLAPAEEGCSAGGGHAQLFESKPEVRTMDRPAVRNVRVLRVERELREARREHAAARQRRVLAAERRAMVVLALLVATAGVLLVASLTPLAAWAALAPLAGAAVAFAVGRHLGVGDRREDQAERRRLAAMEREMRALAGPVGRRAVRAVGSVSTAGSASVAEPAAPALVEPLDAATVAEEAVPEVPVEAGGPAVAEAATEATAQETVLAPAEAVAPGTPPQGWHPVAVPAPTYTLAPRAPRRAYAGVQAEVEAPSAAVPSRPMAVRSFSVDGQQAEEHVFQPIDLDEVLERRRAAGA